MEDSKLHVVETERERPEHRPEAPDVDPRMTRNEKEAAKPVKQPALLARIWKKLDIQLVHVILMVKYGSVTTWDYLANC